ncbi:hypothetical protein AOLI_G00164310 [Acnodon oligacanthus]
MRVFVKVVLMGRSGERQFWSARVSVQRQRHHGTRAPAQESTSVAVLRADRWTAPFIYAWRSEGGDTIKDSERKHIFVTDEDFWRESLVRTVRSPSAATPWILHTHRHFTHEILMKY